MKTALLLIMLSGWWHNANSQVTHGVEQYCMQNGNTFNMIPIVYNQNNNGWYTEARYNYEQFNTFSFSAGKTFSKEADLSLAVTPVAGAVAGALNGGFAGVNAEASYKKWFFSSQSQYVVSAEHKTENFLYSWSQAGYSASMFLDAGLVIQNTKVYNEKGTLVPGFFMQFKFGKWSLPFYIFKPCSSDKSFALGLICEWESRKNKKSK